MRLETWADWVLVWLALAVLVAMILGKASTINKNRERRRGGDRRGQDRDVAENN